MPPEPAGAAWLRHHVTFNTTELMISAYKVLESDALAASP
jgi:hypothetical protein